ncbi:MAG: IS21 family transposase [Bacteroidales bacterium]|jgi:transposase|nr:IS21 family transposase [Bacteroidales bacterium]MDD3011008.1 IS21 family transposase [Bacteroidales bacterium]MDD3962816.1 IS21 family transposase [Bacteroidales bacterium]MDY0287179.1 IS21 family transposase [Bacteroidales bacterium]
MYTKQEIIIKSYREGQSQRSISRELHVSRKTVSKYIREYESHIRDNQSGTTVLSDYLSQPPVYRAQNRSKLKLTREVQAYIDKLLEENAEKKRQGLSKQLLKKCDIHEQLNGQGIDIGYTTVCNYIRSKSTKSQDKEAFIRQKYEPGETCEFDWGEIKLYIKDELVRFQLAVFTSAYSNYRFAAFYQCQDTLAFMESHVAFFDFTKCVYRQMVYDNMRVAVAKFVGRHEKEPTQALLQLRGHYQFSHRFCNAYRGNEKGHVERSVEYIRRKSFGVKCKFDSINEARQWLMFTINKLNATRQKLTGKTANELFAEEVKVLAAAPAKLACAEQVQLRVDKYSTITYRTNRYSVPDHLVGCFIDVKILSLQIQIYQHGALLASHERSYKKHQWIIAIEHYLDTFKQKPGALSGSVALASSDCLKQLYIEYFENEPRDFIDLLDYCHKNQVSDEKLQGAVSRLQKSGVRQITAEKTKVLLGNKQSESTHIPCDQIVQLAKTQLSEQAALIN